MDIARLLGVVGLILLNAFFVTAEYALVSARRSRIDALLAAGNERAGVVQRALRDLGNYIGATQVGVTIASLGLGWIGEPTIEAALRPPLARVIPPALPVVTAHTLAVILAFALITFVSVVFGELVPKSFALQHAEQAAMAVVTPTGVFLRLFRPVIALMNAVSRRVLRLVGVTPALGHSLTYTEDELRLIVESSTQGGQLVESEEEIIRRAFSFHDWAAEDVMVPRTELGAIPVGAPLDAVLETVSATRFARYPVYEGDLDTILGALYVKDLLPAAARRSGEPFSLRPLIRPVLNAPASLRIDDLLDRMKARGTHVAIVVDEYGGTAGMVTLDDITERVIGHVPDEFERSTPDIVEEAGGSVRVDGLALLADVNERFELDLAAGDAVTIGGYVFSRLGRRPAAGDEVPAGGYAIRVESLDGLRIARVRFLPVEQPAASTPRR